MWKVIVFSLFVLLLIHISGKLKFSFKDFSFKIIYIYIYKKFGTLFIEKHFGKNMLLISFLITLYFKVCTFMNNVSVQSQPESPS